VPVPDADLQQNQLVKTLLEKFAKLRKSVQEAGAAEGIDLLDPPELVVLRGFLGASDEEGVTRLYDDPSLGSWSDLPDEYLVHVEHLEKSESRPWGEDVVWMVRGDIQVTDVETDAGRRRRSVYRPARIRRKR
jgi:hypothetical protein